MNKQTLNKVLTQLSNIINDDGFKNDYVYNSNFIDIFYCSIHHFPEYGDEKGIGRNRQWSIELEFVTEYEDKELLERLHSELQSRLKGLKCELYPLNPNDYYIFEID